jgi:hypothetical protein
MTPRARFPNLPGMLAVAVPLARHKALQPSGRVNKRNRATGTRFDYLESQEGRKLSQQEINLSLLQAYLIGQL